MKLGARDTEGFLRTPDKQCQGVLLYGPDSGLVRERAKTISARILAENADPLNRVELTPEQIKAGPAILRDELAALSLMGGRRIVILRGATDKMASIIEEAFAGLSTTTYLIAEAEELTPASALRQLFEQSPTLAALACYRDEGRNLEEVIRAAFSATGLRVTSDALHYLSAHLGSDRGVTQSELEKIALYMGTEKEVTLSVAIALSGYNASETMDDICHAVAAGNVGESNALLTRLLHEGTAPVPIIRALIRHFQRLDLAQGHMASGSNAEQALAALRPPVFFKYMPLAKRELSRWKPRTIAQALKLLLRAEKDLKSSLLSPALLASDTVQKLARLAA